MYFIDKSTKRIQERKDSIFEKSEERLTEPLRLMTEKKKKEKTRK